MEGEQDMCLSKRVNLASFLRSALFFFLFSLFFQESDNSGRNRIRKDKKAKMTKKTEKRKKEFKIAMDRTTDCFEKQEKK